VAELSSFIRPLPKRFDTWLSDTSIHEALPRISSALSFLPANASTLRTNAFVCVARPTYLRDWRIAEFVQKHWNVCPAVLTEGVKTSIDSNGTFLFVWDVNGKNIAGFRVKTVLKYWIETPINIGHDVA
jgi:hypothetical protein